MKLYADAELTKEVKDLDFGIVLAGDVKKVEFYLFNDTVANVVELKPSVDNTEVAVISHPTEIKSNTSAPIVFSWAPSITLKKGLRTQLNLKFFELYE